MQIGDGEPEVRIIYGPDDLKNLKENTFKIPGGSEYRVTISFTVSGQVSGMRLIEKIKRRGLMVDQSDEIMVLLWLSGNIKPISEANLVYLGLIWSKHR